MKPDPELEICLDNVMNADKLRLFPALGDIVKNGRIVEERHCRPGEDPHARSYITMEAEVELAGKILTVRFMILTGHDGTNSYCPMLDEPGPDGDGLNLWFVKS